MAIPQDAISAARKNNHRAIDEATGKKLLHYFGISVPKSIVTKNSNTVANDIMDLNFPVAVKVISQDILHKSDSGGVKVGLGNINDVKDAIIKMSTSSKIQAANVEGYIVEEMAPKGQEIVIGGIKDPQFGPLIMVGLGGIFVEILKDVSFRICPIEEVDAFEMLAELKGSAILEGTRGQNPVSKNAIVDVLMKVGGANGLLLQLEEEVQEADINPLIVSEKKAIAVDARLILTKKEKND